MNKKTGVILLLIQTVLMLLGCQREERPEHPLFSTEEEALEYFIQDRGINGRIIQLDIGNEEHLILAQSLPETYSIGEWVHSNGEYAIVALTGSTDIKNSPAVGVGFQTMERNGYSLKLAKEMEEPGTIHSQELKLHLSMSDLKEDPIAQKSKPNLIQSYTVLK
ncbi:hypothetical protein JCM10914A_02650 [Paenibacillus sp. JCM 10914]|uniref:hypothetical protein n=1 Tax=Paenibacillus sp. JCM 10914 TaxID=1236974 RepID=UPI00055AEC0C|nr:hypothetical protein [Paenibacillus sp. JCM 10914]